MKLLNVLLFISFLLVSGSAYSTVFSDLSSKDWKSSGDNLITYDSSTGLEWLDLSQTLGNSILDTEQEVFFGEFRWATLSEIDGILDAALYGNGYRNTTSSAIWVKRWMDLFSTTKDYTIVNPEITVRHMTSLALTRELSPSGGYQSKIYAYGEAYYRTGFQYEPNGFAYVRDASSGCCYSEADSRLDMAGWLVRDNSWVAPVPEPSSLVLLGLGIVGVAFSRKKCK